MTLGAADAAAENAAAGSYLSTSYSYAVPTSGQAGQSAAAGAAAAGAHQQAAAPQAATHSQQAQQHAQPQGATAPSAAAAAPTAAPLTNPGATALVDEVVTGLRRSHPSLVTEVERMLVRAPPSAAPPRPPHILTAPGRAQEQLFRKFKPTPKEELLGACAGSTRRAREAHGRAAVQAPCTRWCSSASSTSRRRATRCPRRSRRPLRA